MPLRRSAWSRPALVFTLYLAMAVVALLWCWARSGRLAWVLDTAPAPGSGGPGGGAGPVPHFGTARRWVSLVLGVAAGGALVYASRLALRFTAWARAFHEDLRGLLGPLGRREILVLALASSVGEELFFRGALMPVVGVIISSFIFALLHVDPRAQYLPWTAGAFVAGLLFSAIFLLTGDLTGAVVAHFLVNFLNLRHLARRA